jgi:hypothetical protein
MDSFSDHTFFSWFNNFLAFWIFLSRGSTMFGPCPILLRLLIAPSFTEHFLSCQLLFCPYTCNVALFSLLQSIERYYNINEMKYVKNMLHTQKIKSAEGCWRQCSCWRRRHRVVNSESCSVRRFGTTKNCI